MKVSIQYNGGRANKGKWYVLRIRFEKPELEILGLENGTGSVLVMGAAQRCLQFYGTNDDHYGYRVKRGVLSIAVKHVLAAREEIPTHEMKTITAPGIRALMTVRALPRKFWDKRAPKVLLKGLEG
jgi:hypothetical protein